MVTIHAYFSYVATFMNKDLYAYCLSFTHSCQLPTLLNFQTRIILPRLTGLCSIGLTGPSSGVLWYTSPPPLCSLCVLAPDSVDDGLPEDCPTPPEDTGGDDSAALRSLTIVKLNSHVYEWSDCWVEFIINIFYIILDDNTVCSQGWKITIGLHRKTLTF